MSSLRVIAVSVLVMLINVSNASACIPHFLTRVSFDNKDGNDVILNIDESMSGKKRAVYYIKDDFDGSVKILAVGLAAKNLDEKDLQAYKAHLRDALVKFINYWDDPKLKRKTSKATKEAVVKARKLLAQLKEERLTENLVEDVLNDVIAKVNNERAGKKRENHFKVYNEKGELDSKDGMTSIAKSLESQLPKGFYESAMDRTVYRGGVFGAAEDANTGCGPKTYAADIALRPEPNKLDKIPRPSDPARKHQKQRQSEDAKTAE